MSKHGSNNRNPFHPSALRIGDLTVGRTIVWFSLGYNAVRYRVLERPRVTTPSWASYGHSFITVKLLNLATGIATRPLLSDLGVISRKEPWCLDGEWDESAGFVVDHRKAHLLPDIPPRQLPMEMEWPGMRYPSA